jgi:hypothetical protein
MCAGHVGLAALQRQQTSKAADIGSRNFELRMMLLELIFDHTDGEIVTTGAKNRIFDILSRTKQIDLNFLTFV